MNVVEIATPDSVVEKAGYMMANPVVAGLVKDGWAWPGMRTRPEDFVEKPRTIRRPDIPFFRHSRLPVEVKLRYAVPPFHGAMTRGEFAAALDGARERHEFAAREAVKAAGRGFLGLEALRRVRWSACAQGGVSDKSGFIPFVAATSREVMDAVRERIQAFRVAYHQALGAFVAGAREVVFPHGTWKMRVLFGVACLPPP